MGFYEAKTDIRYTASIGHWTAISGTIKDTGVNANPDGKKIIPAGYPVKGATNKILKDRDAAVVCGLGDGLLAEVILAAEVDVTDGDQPATFLTRGMLDAKKLPSWPSAAQTTLEAKGFSFVGDVTHYNPPTLAFDLVYDGEEPGKVSITTVEPELAATGYRAVVVDGPVSYAEVGTVITTVGASYTLEASIEAAEGKFVVLYEVDAANKVVKAGSALVEEPAAPELTFTVVDHTTPGSVMIETVDPELTETGYIVEVHEDDDFVLNGLGRDLTGGDSYTLEAAIVAENGNYIALYEVDETDKVALAGVALVAIEE